MRRLKYPVSVKGKVVAGEKAGRTIGFPTANLKLVSLPKISPGVYAAVCSLGKKNYLGLAYWGKRYIFGDKKLSFEVYLIDFSQSIYGRELKVELTHFLRGPKRLKNLKEVKKALTADLDAIKREQVVLVNGQDKILGITSVTKAHQNPPRLHRASSVYLVNKKGEMLIQKRSRFKPVWPLYWSNTCCTNTRPGETPLEAAKRSLKIEMSLNTPLKFNHRLVYRASYNKRLAEYELDSIFTGVVKVKPKLNRREAAAYRFVDFEDLKKEIKEKPDQFTPWFKQTLKELRLSDIFKS